MNSVQSKINENEESSKENKISATTYMTLLLEEFHTSKNTGASAKSMEALEHQINDDEESKKFEDDSSPELANPKGTAMREETDDNFELKTQILNHIGDNRISQLISYMLNSVLSKYDKEIKPEILNMLKSEIKEALFSKISDMLDALFSEDLDEWLRLLMIDEPNEDQIEYFENIRKQISKTSKLKNKVTLDNIDDIAKVILQTTELKQELAKLVATLGSSFIK